MTNEKVKALHLNFGTLLVGFAYNGQVYKGAAKQLNAVLSEIIEEFEKLTDDLTQKNESLQQEVESLRRKVSEQD